MLTILGIIFIGWYSWLTVLGYKVRSKKGGYNKLSAVIWAITWPIRVHKNIKSYTDR